MEKAENRGDGERAEQSATVAAAGCGESRAEGAGARELGRKRRAGEGGGGRGGGGNTEPSGTVAASASMGAAAAIQRAPLLSTLVVNSKWTAIYGPLQAESLTFSFTHTHARILL